MPRQKQIRRKGKLSLTNYFKELKEGDKVAIVRELSLPVYFPKRIQGLSGVVVSRKGSSYVVRLRQGRKVKDFIIKPAHLKKIR